MRVYRSGMNAGSNIERPDAGFWNIPEVNSYTSTTSMSPVETHESWTEVVGLVGTFSYLGFRLKAKKVYIKFTSTNSSTYEEVHDKWSDSAYGCFIRHKFFGFRLKVKKV